MDFTVACYAMASCTYTMHIEQDVLQGCAFIGGLFLLAAVIVGASIYGKSR